MVIRLFLLVVFCLSSQFSEAKLSCQIVFTQHQQTAKSDGLRFMSYNVYNLFSLTGKYVWGEKGLERSAKKDRELQKSELQTQELAKVISETNPDFLLLQEVEGIAALLRFNEYYLKDQYETYMAKTNDERGIGIALLVKKNLSLEVELEAHENLTFKNSNNNNRKENVFTRSFPVYKISQKGQQEPSLIIAGVHLKSRRDRRNDPKSYFKRSSEIEHATEILRETIEWHPGIPLIVMGDFNSARGQREVESLREELRLIDPHVSEAHFTDPFNLGLTTHTYHPNAKGVVNGALDIALLTQNLIDSIIQSRIYRYRDSAGQVKNLPTTIEERNENPSDHFPIYFDLALDL